VAVFLHENGTLRGPSEFSTIGMRIQNEQSGSSSLFAQPLSLESVPEKQGTEKLGTREQKDGETGNEGAERQGAREQGGKEVDGSPLRSHRTELERRLSTVLAKLATTADQPNTTQRQGHLALLKRWYYRPEAKRTGEIFFPDAGDHWPLRSILRGVGRVAAKSLIPHS